MRTHIQPCNFNHITSFAYEAIFPNGEVFEVIHSNEGIIGVMLGNQELTLSKNIPETLGFRITAEKNSKGIAKVYAVAFPYSGVYCIIPAISSHQ